MNRRETGAQAALTPRGPEVELLWRIQAPQLAMVGERLACFLEVRLQRDAAMCGPCGGYPVSNLAGCASGGPQRRIARVTRELKILVAHVALGSWVSNLEAVDLESAADRAVRAVRRLGKGAA